MDEKGNVILESTFAIIIKNQYTAFFHINFINTYKIKIYENIFLFEINYNLCKIYTPIIVTIHILVYTLDIIKVFKNHTL